MQSQRFPFDSVFWNENALGGNAAYASLATTTFSRPMSAKSWLDASNPSERWKWDFMYQDLPPVKGTVDPSALPLPPGLIPLKEVK